jgi:hypothetical protein
MADVEDGQIKVACLVPTDERLVVNGVLSRTQHGVIFDRSNFVVDWLHHNDSAGQTVTILLSNNGRRETYSFANRNATPAAERALDCKMPKKPKR